MVALMVDKIQMATANQVSINQIVLSAIATTALVMSLTVELEMA
jgi:hypothetical protein